MASILFDFTAQRARFIMDFNISSVSSPNFYNPQIANKVAAVNSANLANNAANQSAFSSYIGQALAQIGVANPTNSSAPVVSGANKANSSQKSLGSFVQDLFTILSEKSTSQESATSVITQQANLKQAFSQDNETSESSSDSESNGINEAAVFAYAGNNSTTVGNIASNLQTLVRQLNDASRNTGNSSSAIQALQNGFQSILDAQGASATNSGATLGSFLQALAQNLQGQSPLGIIINTQA